MLENYIQGFRMVNAMVRGLPAQNIESLLTDEIRASSLVRVLQRQSQCARLTETPLALQNMALSATAYALLPEPVRLAILNDPIAIQNLTAIILGEDPANITFENIADFVNDEAVMSVVFASAPAAAVIASSQTAMEAVVKSGAALNVLWKTGGQPAVEAMKRAVPAQKAFVDGPLYAEAFKKAVQKGIMLGEKIINSSGNFTLPEYVSKIHIVCVGRGGDGGSRKVAIGSAGGGGALRWGNNIKIVRGEPLNAIIDSSQTSILGIIAGAGKEWVESLGGAGGIGSGGDGGGNGGNGGIGSGYGGGGGGAGGYTGDGGAGAKGAGSGAGGGGVGIFGIGQSGGSVAGWNGLSGAGNGGGAGGGGNVGGKAGSGGTDGVPSSINGTMTGGLYGGGGGGSGFKYDEQPILRYLGGSGVIRIIWGPLRAFPATNVEKIV